MQRRTYTRQGAFQILDGTTNPVVWDVSKGGRAYLRRPVGPYSIAILNVVEGRHYSLIITAISVLKQQAIDSTPACLHVSQRMMRVTREVSMVDRRLSRSQVGSSFGLTSGVLGASESIIRTDPVVRRPAKPLIHQFLTLEVNVANAFISVTRSDS